MDPKRTGRTRRLLNTTLYELENGFFEDAKGTVYALADPKLGVDNTDQAGVGIFVLPRDHFLSKAAVMHDYMFTSPVYQAYHTMTEANLWFLQNAAILGKGKTGARVWLWIARQAVNRLGGYFWDNPETRK